MKKIYNLLLLAIFSLAIVQSTNAQLPNGSIAPDFTTTDIYGVEHNLYDLLDEGKTVILDVFATWCGPCWSYHQGHILENVYSTYGPDGTDELFVIAIEADGNTDADCIFGPSTCNANSIGDWTTGISYPIVDDSAINNLYNISFFPTIYIVYPNRIIDQLGQQPISVVEDKIDDYEKAGTGLAPKVIKYSGFSGSLCNDLWPVAPGYIVSNYGTETIESCNIVVRKNEEVIYEEEWTGEAGTYGIITNFNLSTIIVTENTKIVLSLENINGLEENRYDYETGVTIETNNVIKVNVDTDAFALADNNRYEIINEAGDVIISKQLSQNNASIENVHYLEEAACYNFVIHDDAENGIDGLVDVRDGEGNLIYSNVQNFEAADARRFNVSLVSSTGDLLSDVRLSVSPNPAYGEILLSIEGNRVDDYELSILTHQGQTVLTKDLNQVRSDQFPIDLTGLTSGLYFIHLQSEKGILTQKLVVK